MRKLATLALIFALAIPACNGPAPTPAPPTPVPVPNPGNGGWVPPPAVDTTITTLIAQINQARAGKHLPALVAEPHLMAAAKMQADNMARLNTMSHTLPVPGEGTLTQRLAACGYTGWMGAAENIAWNYTTDNVVQGWLNSPGHYANIMGNYTQTGMAISKNSQGQPYYAQTFGKR